MKLQVIIQAKGVISTEQRKQLEQKVKSKLNADVLVLDDSVDSLLMAAPYTFEERMGDYSWKAGVQTIDELIQIVDRFSTV